MKQLLLTLLCATALFGCNAGTTSNKAAERATSPELNIINGKPITELIANNQNSVLPNYIRSSAGLIIQKTTGVSACTGVIIGDDAILTAKHCVKNILKDSQMKIYLMDKQGNELDPQILTPSNVYVPKYSENDYIETGADVAIIKFMKNPSIFKGKSTTPVPVMSVKTSSASLQQEFLINKYLATNYIKAPSTFYRIGWGAKGDFEYSAVNFSCATKSNVVFGTATEKIEAILPDSIKDPFSTLTFQKSKKMEGTCLKENKLIANTWSNYNLFGQELFDNGQITEGGDSGGPLIVCTNKNVNCELIGVHSHRDTLKNTSFATNLLNPYAIPLILNEIFSPDKSPDGKMFQDLYK